MPDASHVCGYCHARLSPGHPCGHYPECCPKCGWPYKPERGCGACGHALKPPLELLAMDLGIPFDQLADLAAARLDVRRLMEPKG